MEGRCSNEVKQLVLLDEEAIIDVQSPIPASARCAAKTLKMAFTLFLNPFWGVTIPLFIFIYSFFSSIRLYFVHLVFVTQQRHPDTGSLDVRKYCKKYEII